jgi:hypothetical protein
MRLSRKSLLILPVIFLVFLEIFLWTAAPSVLFGDSGELQTVALCGGVAHPTGYPTFVLLGQAFGRLPGGDPARRITAMSAFFAAASVCALFLVLKKYGLSTGIALAGAMVYGFSFTFWWSAIRAEVYTLSIFLFLTSLWLVLHALERPSLARASMAAAALGLAMTGHHAFAPAVLVLGLVLAFNTPAGSRRAIYWPVLGAAFIAGLAPYAYCMWADSTGCPMNYLRYSIELSSGQYGLTEETFTNPFRRLFWLVRGGDAASINLLDPGELARTSVQLFITQFIYQFGIIALPVFVLGIYHLLKNRDRKTWILFGTILTAAVFSIVIGNRRMLPIFAMPITIFVAIAISFGLLALRRRIFGDRKHLTPREALIVILFVAAMIATPHLVRCSWDRSTAIKNSMKVLVEAEPEITTIIPTLRDYKEPRIFGERVLQLAPRNALIVGSWDIMALYYLHHVEGMRPDIALEPYFLEHYVRLERWEEQYDLMERPIVFIGRITGRIEDSANLEEIAVDEKSSMYVCRGPLSSIEKCLRH